MNDRYEIWCCEDFKPSSHWVGSNSLDEAIKRAYFLRVDFLLRAGSKPAPHFVVVDTLINPKGSEASQVSFCHVWMSFRLDDLNRGAALINLDSVV